MGVLDRDVCSSGQVDSRALSRNHDDMGALHRVAVSVYDCVVPLHDDGGADVCGEKVGDVVACNDVRCSWTLPSALM